MKNGLSPFGGGKYFDLRPRLRIATLGAVSSDILTCRCRHCGKTFPYLRSDAGTTVECPECRNSVLLPGKLATIATKQKGRVTSPLGLFFEIGGFLLMVWFPIGTLIGFILVIIGWRRSYSLRCSNCEEPTSASAARCRKCRAAFSSD